MRSLDVAVALALATACGDGGMQAHVAPDAAADAADVANDAAAAPDADAAESRVADVGSASDAADALADGDHRAPDAGGVEVGADLSAPRASATASWTIAPNPVCVAAGAGCMDTGGVGGYQITASGTCPTASDVQLWFPGGSTPLAAGTYAVKPAAGILDVIAMPAGLVGVLAERDTANNGHARLWGRSGTVTVSASGATRRVTLSGVALRDEASSATTTLAADVSCP